MHNNDLKNYFIVINRDGRRILVRAELTDQAHDSAITVWPQWDSNPLTSLDDSVH